MTYCHLKIVIFANSGKFLDFLAILTTPNSPINLQNISIISISVISISIISISYNHSRSLKGFKIFDWTPIGWSAMEWAISNIFFICIFYWSSINSNNNNNGKCNISRFGSATQVLPSDIREYFSSCFVFAWKAKCFTFASFLHLLLLHYFSGIWSKKNILQTFKQSIQFSYLLL